jgi:3'(2'), 5'-bisphosphate nucleotidase
VTSGRPEDPAYADGGDDGERSDAELSRTVAREAGALLREMRESFGVIEPGDWHRATLLRDTADREAHLLILRRLTEARPADVVLSEEGDDDIVRMSAPRVWIVDPLDGTWEYGQGRDDYAVHVALWHADGRLTAGTVDLPATGRTYSTLDEPPSYAGLPVDRAVRVVVSRSRRPADLDRMLARLTELLVAAGHDDLAVEAVEVGSVGAKAAELFAGRAEIYWHDTGFRDWDLAAPLAVARHRGLWCASPDGSELLLNRRPPVQAGIVMAVPALAEAARLALGLA